MRPTVATGGWLALAVGASILILNLDRLGFSIDFYLSTPHAFVLFAALEAFALFVVFPALGAGDARPRQSLRFASWWAIGLPFAALHAGVSATPTASIVATEIGLLALGGVAIWIASAAGETRSRLAMIAMAIAFVPPIAEFASRSYGFSMPGSVDGLSPVVAVVRVASGSEDATVGTAAAIWLALGALGWAASLVRRRDGAPSAGTLAACVIPAALLAGSASTQAQSVSLEVEAPLGEWSRSGARVEVSCDRAGFAGEVRARLGEGTEIVRSIELGPSGAQTFWMPLVDPPDTGSEWRVGIEPEGPTERRALRAPSREDRLVGVVGAPATSLQDTEIGAAAFPDATVHAIAIEAPSRTSASGGLEPLDLLVIGDGVARWGEDELAWLADGCRRGLAFVVLGTSARDALIEHGLVENRSGDGADEESSPSEDRARLGWGRGFVLADAAPLSESARARLAALASDPSLRLPRRWLEPDPWVGLRGEEGYRGPSVTTLSATAFLFGLVFLSVVFVLRWSSDGRRAAALGGASVVLLAVVAVLRPVPSPVLLTTGKLAFVDVASGQGWVAERARAYPLADTDSELRIDGGERVHRLDPPVPGDRGRLTDDGIRFVLEHDARVPAAFEAVRRLSLDAAGSTEGPLANPLGVALREATVVGSEGWRAAGTLVPGGFADVSRSPMEVESLEAAMPGAAISGASARAGRGEWVEYVLSRLDRYRPVLGEREILIGWTPAEETGAAEGAVSGRETSLRALSTGPMRSSQPVRRLDEPTVWVLFR